MRGTVNIYLMFCLIPAAMALGGVSYIDAKAAANPVSSGKTQVMARIDQREITISEVEQEMQRLGLNPTQPESKAIAVNAIMDRYLFAKDARRAKIDKRPEAMWRMEAAREQALAEIYVNIVSQAPEPTRAELEIYMQEHPDLFKKAKRYGFSVIETAADGLDLDAITPLFDETKDFKDFEAWLKERNIRYTLSPATRDGASFPAPIRKRLGEYGPGDNVVLQGDNVVTIMKIITIEDAPLNFNEGAPLARTLIRQQRAQERLGAKRDALRENATIDYFRDGLALPQSTPEETR